MSEQKLEIENETKSSVVPIVLGIINLITWLIVFIGLPVSIIGLVISIKKFKSEKSTKAKVGIILCTIGLVLVIANAIIGAYMGATGKIKIMN